MYRPGKVNVRADRLSRWKHDHTDIRLSKAAFEIVDRRYGPHSVDLFATRDNRLLPRYVSWHPDPSAVAVDAFLFPLKGENPYCFPPVTCIPRLLREVLRQQVTVTLIAPDWQAAWRPDLDRLLLDPPLRLPTDSIKRHRLDPPSLETDLFSDLRVVLEAIAIGRPEGFIDSILRCQKPKTYSTRWSHYKSWCLDMCLHP